MLAMSKPEPDATKGSRFDDTDVSDTAASVWDVMDDEGSDPCKDHVGTIQL